MTLLQPFNALVLWLSLLIVIRCVVLVPDEPEEKIYSCPVIQGSVPAVNGLPGRYGRDGPKGENGEPEEESRGLQGFPGKAGPPEIKEDLGPQGEKGENGENGTVVTDDLHRQVTALETKVQGLEAELNRDEKAKGRSLITLILKNIKSIGKKIFVSTEKEGTFDNGKSLCAKAGSALASPRNETENTALKDLSLLQRCCYKGISAEQTEGTFMYLNGEAVIYRNWNAGEPNNLKNEDCAVMQDSGK
ncbi:MBL protein, partial [Pandion haliaetus]|nr:MBL protein [Pandion haliaetus]